MSNPEAFLVAQTRGLQAISDGNGIGISVTGMLIVFFALAIITTFIGLLPRLLTALEPYLPAAESHHDARRPEERLPIDDQRIVAAIGFVLHSEMRRTTSTTE